MSVKPVAFNIGWELEATSQAQFIPANVGTLSDASVNGVGIEYYLKKDTVGNNPVALQKLRKLVSDKKIRVDRSCGFHVHISPNNLSREKSKSWAGWMTTLARMTEDDAFNAVPESRRDNSMCLRLKNTKHSIKGRSYNSSKYSNQDRYYWMNVVEMMRPGGIRTVEIRLLGSTRRFIWLQAWIAMCLYMAKIANELMDDPSGLQWRVEEISKAFIKMKMFLARSHPDSIKTSMTMVKNMGLIEEPKTYPNREAFLKRCGQIRNGNYYSTPVNPVYTTEQVKHYRALAEIREIRDTVIRPVVETTEHSIGQRGETTCLNISLSGSARSIFENGITPSTRP